MHKYIFKNLILIIVKYVGIGILQTTNVTKVA